MTEISDSDKAEYQRKSFKKRKSVIRRILKNRNWDLLQQLARDGNLLFRGLTSLSFDKEELIRWRAIEAIGITASIEAERDPQKVKKMISNQLWMMNDESGALSWHGPEMIAEILYNVPGLMGQYAKLLPHYLKEEPFERGTHWA
ncbi:MAG: hypothetical protein GF315_08365, partial [candidate division Zixibacteria bacterium]|nr:hypothetical protein [candidate division Zixibacteria bacterium]